MGEKLSMKVAYKTDVGKKRAHNEDHILVDESLCIFLLADGMGGHQAGEVASHLAITECYAWLKENVGAIGMGGNVSSLLTESLVKAHLAVKSAAEANGNLAGMGTTLIQTLLMGNTAHICHVGDSRVYLLRDGLRQLTKDHTSEMSFVKEWTQGDGQPVMQTMRVLNQAIGGKETPSPELLHVPLREKDVLLLCSDGLTDMLPEKEIESIVLRRRDNLPESVDCLVREANARGGVDNISVILIECG